MAMSAPPRIMERQLNVVSISLALAAGGPRSTSESESCVLFEVKVNNEQVGLLEATVSEIGLPLSLAQARTVQSTESGYKAPDHIAASLAQVIQQNGQPLWLAFPLPSGYLPVVPWESLLQSWLHVPILRLGYSEVQPVVSYGSLDVVVCFSFPAAKMRIQALQPAEVIHYYFDHVPENIRQYTTFHVFVDASAQYVLKDVLARHSDCRIRVYDPGMASRYDVPEQDSTPEASTAELESPWLLWMRDAMGALSADLVHFFCHGYLGREDGFLCFSQP